MAGGTAIERQIAAAEKARQAAYRRTLAPHKPGHAGKRVAHYAAVGELRELDEKLARLRRQLDQLRADEKRRASAPARGLRREHRAAAAGELRLFNPFRWLAAVV